MDTAKGPLSILIQSVRKKAGLLLNFSVAGSSSSSTLLSFLHLFSCDLCLMVNLYPQVFDICCKFTTEFQSISPKSSTVSQELCPISKGAAGLCLAIRTFLYQNRRSGDLLCLNQVHTQYDAILDNETPPPPGFTANIRQS